MPAAGRHRVVFELGARAQVSAGQEILGLWTLVPVPAAQAVSFDTGPAPTAEAPLWVADLPADPELAAQRLTRAETGLAASQQALAAAEARLDAFATRQQAGTGVSFAADTAGGEAARPERELERLLLEIGQDERTVSYGLREKLASRFSEVGEQFEAFLGRLEQQIAHYAWVETRSQGQLWARTVVSWMGDSDTTWQAGGIQAQMALHRRTVALALESRETLLRTLVVVTRGAATLAKLPILLGTPGGAILALPVAWRFINDVRVELDQRLHD